MISLVILLFVFMGLIQASLVSINSNLRNEIRDEAVRVASEHMAIARSTPVDTLAANVCPAGTLPPAPLNRTVNRTIRNLQQPYPVVTSGCFIDATRISARVTVTVTYVYPDDSVANTQSITTIVKRP